MAQQELSEAAQRSASYYAVRGLFAMAEGLWRSLNFHTQESLAVFVDAKQYLTPTEEHDLVSLTSDYVSSLLSASNTQFVINGDSALTDAERAVFSEALKLFHSTASTTAIALGRPRWIEGDR